MNNDIKINNNKINIIIKKSYKFAKDYKTQNAKVIEQIINMMKEELKNEDK